MGARNGTGVRDRIAQQDLEAEQTQQLSFSESMNSTLESLADRVETLVEAQNQITTTLRQMSTSQSSATSSQLDGLTSRVAELKSQQTHATTEIAQTLEAMGETLSSSQPVKLPDGSQASSGDLEALSMMRKLEAQMKDMASATEQQAKAVRAKSTARLDTEKVVEVLTEKVASKYEAMIEQSVSRVEEALEAQESRLEVAGEQRVTEMTERLEKAAKVLERANDRSAKLSRVITWQSAGRLLLALLPLALFALAVALVLDLGGAMLNINGLYAWAWSMFDGAQQWWSKGLIALGTLASVAGLVWLVYRGGKWLHEVYEGWR